ncbi:putative baseplate assembly protein [Sanguibacter sp. A247]|uniref:putative baseplate assembly protein n=1 Tax=unclassified Sanguibacter TaxID=2645534 RepID=UPI003FD7205A
MPPIIPPNLDDRSFQDIVDETKRLIPRHTPEWTNHNVSDPGVALVELFAWMSEMVLFRVNQVPERMYTHFLNLVGVEPFGPSAATTDLTFWFSAPARADVVVPAGVEVATARSATAAAGDDIVFTTVRDAVARPATLRSVLTSAAGSDHLVDSWTDLAYQGTSLAVFPSPEIAENDATYLGFTTSLADHALALTVTADVLGIGIDPSDPPLVWEAWDGEAWVRLTVNDDTTGGLNRDGRIVLLMPAAHPPLTLGGTGAHWVRVRLVRAAPGRPTYRTSPRLTSLDVGVVGVSVPAEHAASRPAEILGRSTGAAGQIFRVAHAPVLARRDGEEVAVVTATHVESWTEVPDFASSGPTDKHVVWEATTGEIRFGPSVRHPDGTVRQHGAIPADGAQIRVSPYRSGGGAHGNVGPGALSVARSTLPMVASVTNALAATGGVDAETVDEAKVRGPLTLRTGRRAVTASDYERLALAASPAVARARCIPLGDPVASRSGAVRVLLVPAAPRRGATEDRDIDDLALSPQLRDVVGAELDACRLVGVGLEVGAPFYQGASAAVLVRALPGRPAAVVRQRVLEALHARIDPLHGGADGSGWPFDHDLTAAALAQVVDEVEGVERVEEVTLFDYDLRSRRRVGDGQDALTLTPGALFVSAAHRVVVR